MDSVTVAQMKEIERQANEAGLPYYQMMENAGTKSYDVILAEYPEVRNLLVFCGKGNNGGDGLVVARLAALDGKKVQVVLVEGEPVTVDAKTNFDKLPEEVLVVSIDDLGTEVSRDDKPLVVDALYGTGFHGELRENGRKACKIMNELGGEVFALDIPSGCDADNATSSLGAVMADITVAFHAYKNVHTKPLGNCGRCILASIGIEKVMENRTLLPDNLDERLKKQLEFSLEIDKEKNIFRQTHLSDHGRNENDAEHAWHMAIMAYILKEYSNEEIDISKVMLMCLIHDVVEIDAGDTYAYDEVNLKTQKEREDKAKERIFSLLPDDLKEILISLFDEFEEGKTAEAKFAKAMDNLQPLILNNSNNGGDWKEHGVSSKQVYGRQSKTAAGSKILYEVTEAIIKENIKKGSLRE